MFKDRNEEKEGFLDRCRKRMKQVARVAMAVVVGGCLWGQGELGFAKTQYYFYNPSSGNEINFDESGYHSNNTPYIYDMTFASNNDDEIQIMNHDVTTASYTGNDVSNNNLTINGGSYQSVMIYSGISNGERGNNCSNNNIIINGGTVSYASEGLVYTNNSYDYESTGYYQDHGIGNTITINDGTVGRADANTINIYGGSIKDSYVISDDAGYTGEIVVNPTSDLRTAGEINIYNAPDLSEAVISANNIATYDGSNGSTTISGATLNIHTKDLTAKNIRGFDNVNFYLPSNIKNGDTILTLTGYTSNTEYTLNGSHYDSLTTNLSNATIRAGVEGDANLSTGDKITLIKNENGLITEGTSYGTLSEGVSLDYEMTVEQEDNTSIVAKIGTVAPEAGEKTAGLVTSSSSLNPQTNLLPKPLLSTSTLTLQGTDRLLEWLPLEDFSVEDEKSGTQEAEVEENTGTVASDGGGQIIANAGVSSMRIKTGANSYMNNHSGGFDVGMARTIKNRHGRLIFAPIVDYGSGTYDAYTDNGREMHGWGSTKYWAGGMIARQINDNGFYYEGSFRAGRTTLDFSSDDFLVQGNPTYEHYDTSAPFFAGHLRVGRVYRIARNNQLHLYGIYSHTHQNGMTAHLSTGETYNFSAVDSGRLRIGARLSWQKKKTQRFYSGIAYQYEYATGVSGTYRGRSTDSSGIHGSSAMLELGWQVKPSERSSWMVDVGAVGWVGHQKGVAFQVQMKKAF